MRISRLAGAAAALSAIALSGACHKSSDTTAPSVTGTTDAYLASVSVAGVGGTYTGTAAPVANGGPAIAITGNALVVNGGTNQIAFTSTTAVARLYVWVSGLNGYYDVPAPAPGTGATIVVSYAQGPPTNTFVFSVAGVTAGGAVGAPATISTTVTTVGTGDVQVSLSWDVNSDVDLHVTEPSGEEIYWNNRTSATHGTLDLDSNAACNLDGRRNENVTWPTGTAPRGTYTVKVDLWGACGQTSTNWIVRVSQNGTATNYTGTLTGNGDQGGRGSGTLVTTFTR